MPGSWVGRGSPRISGIGLREVPRGPEGTHSLTSVRLGVGDWGRRRRKDGEEWVRGKLGKVAGGGDRGAEEKSGRQRRAQGSGGRVGGH